MAAGGRRRSGTIFILLALVLILILAVAAFMLRDQIFPKPQAEVVTAPTPSQPMVDIIVLAQPVVRGTTITEDMLATIPYPQSDMVQGLFFTDKNQVSGRRASYDLPQGMPLTSGQITDLDKGSFAAFRVPRGMVAVAIPISRLTSVAYALQAGDHVNIIGSILLVDLDANFQSRLPNNTAQVIGPGPGAEGAASTITMSIVPQDGQQGRGELDPVFNQAMYLLPSEEQRPRLVSQMLIQDAIVLWMGDFPVDGKISEQPQPTPTPVAEGEAPAPVVPPRPDIVSLIVSPQDAVTLNYLMLSGAKLNLALRGSGDFDKTPTEAVTLQFLLDQYNIPSPAKLPYGMDPARRDLVFPTAP